MMYEKQLTTTKENEKVVYTYYVKKTKSRTFECDMYNVGIKTRGETREIEDFSPSEKEAVALCDYLYRGNVTPENIFLMGEEFLEKMSI